MTNTNMLKSVMALHGVRNFVQCIADMLSISRGTASKKVNGKAEFTQSEIATIAKRYCLSAAEIEQIFVGE